MHTAAAMVSAIEYCSKPIVFHILHEERISFKHRIDADNNMNKYIKLANKYGSKVCFHNVILPDKIVSSDNCSKYCNMPPVTFIRYYLQDILFDLDYVISIGSDMIFRTDLAKIISEVPDGFSIAACPDPGTAHNLIGVPIRE